MIDARLLGLAQMAMESLRNMERSLKSIHSVLELVLVDKQLREIEPTSTVIPAEESEMPLSEIRSRVRQTLQPDQVEYFRNALRNPDLEGQSRDDVIDAFAVKMRSILNILGIT